MAKHALQSRGLKLWLIAGFSLVLVLLAVVLVAGLRSMAEIQTRLSVIVENHNVKTTLVADMRNAARDRTIAMYRMITLTDPFARDGETIHYNHFAAEFAQARTLLLAMPLDAREHDLLKVQGKITGLTVELQNQVVDLALRDKTNEASELLYAKTVPAQDRVFAILAELQDYQTQATQSAAQAARKNYDEARAIMLLFGTAALLLGITIAAFVIRHSSRTETRLFREKERAQVTLHSIGEGVITTDAQGAVEYVNDVAAALTGWSSAQARGHALPEMFCVVDEGHGLSPPNPVTSAIAENRIVTSPKHQILTRPDGQQFAVEYTAAPIRDFDDGILGAILVFRNITIIHDMAQQMAHQATHDALTGLINRNEFEQRLKLALGSASTDDEQHALLYIDLDQFKVINDTCGHIAGDELLKQIAALLKTKLRRMDTLARLGGDEFGLLLQACPLENAAHIAGELLHNIREFRYTWKDKPFEIGASIGVAAINAQTPNIGDVLAAADSACYVAKDQGRNRVQIYRADDALLTKRRGEMQWLPRIRHALKEDRFRLYHQRIVALAPETHGQHHEILLRLLDEENRIVPPGAFIPAAERYDLMPAIDRWVIQATLQFLKSDPMYTRDRFWAINLSGQTVCDEHLLQFITEQFERSGISPRAICFEITETTAISNLAYASNLIVTLKKLGCQFALDDFGSGLSSFNYLKNLPVDFLKIDGSFVKHMVDNPKDSAMVQSIHQIGKILGLKTIAEFVENNAIVEKLRTLGVDFAQGYALHRPEALEDWARSERERIK